MALSLNKLRLVAVGGGTGLATLLRGIRGYVRRHDEDEEAPLDLSSLTAVVTVSDDAGATGKLIDEFGILPPGDVRVCLASLADEEELLTKLFLHKFVGGGAFSEQSFGNLFLTALIQMNDNDYLRAIKDASRVLRVEGTILPATPERVRLCAETEDGRVLVFTTGMAGMSLSIVLMFVYQSTFGSLFLDIGLIPKLNMGFVPHVEFGQNIGRVSLQTDFGCLILIMDNMDETVYGTDRRYGFILFYDLAAPVAITQELSIVTEFNAAVALDGLLGTGFAITIGPRYTVSGFSAGVGIQLPIGVDNKPPDDDKMVGRYDAAILARHHIAAILDLSYSF